MIIEPTEHVNEDTPFPKKFWGRIFPGSEVTFFRFYILWLRFSTFHSNEWELWAMTQMRMSQQPQNKYSCISPLHLHIKVPQCMGFLSIPLHEKGFF